MSVRNVGNLFPGAQHSFDIKELTQVKGLMCAVSVGSLLSREITFLYTREFTQDEGLMIATNGQNPLRIVPSSLVSSQWFKACECKKCRKSFSHKSHILTTLDFIFENCFLGVGIVGSVLTVSLVFVIV